MLRKMRIPTHIAQAILALYEDIYVDILMPGGCVKWFTVECGIKQGCPLSGTLFAICLGPCLRFLIHLLPPMCRLQAYADDMVAGLSKLIPALKILVVVFGWLPLPPTFTLPPPRSM